MGPKQAENDHRQHGHREEEQSDDDNHDRGLPAVLGLRVVSATPAVAIAVGTGSGACPAARSLAVS